MSYLETQQNDAQAAREEARRLRTKMKTFQKYDAVLFWLLIGPCKNFILFNFFFVACCLMSFGAKVLVLDDAAFAAWMCCYRARELRWSPWSQTWASVRRRWSSSPSTASPSRSKFRIWTPPSLQRLVSWLRCCQQCFYCFFLFILKRVRQSERNAEVFERPQREAEARSALLKQQGSFVFPPLMKSFMSVKPPHLSLIVSLKRHF